MEFPESWFSLPKLLPGRRLLIFKYTSLSIPAYLIAEMVALAIGIWCFSRLPNMAFKALVVFLGFIVSVEWYGVIAGQVLRKATAWLFNFSVPIEYMFFVWFLAAHFNKPLSVRLSRAYILAFAIFVFLYNIFSTEIGFHAIYIKIGILGVLLFCSLYFSELLRQDEVVNPVAIPTFWICCGLFIFNLGEFVYGFGLSRIAENPNAWKSIFRELNSKLNVILYSCISVGFVMASWRK